LNVYQLFRVLREQRSTDFFVSVVTPLFTMQLILNQMLLRPGGAMSAMLKLTGKGKLGAIA